MAPLHRTMRGLLLGLVVALVGCDHATKVVAKIELEGAPARAIVPGVLELVYTENRDAAFSLSHAITNPAKGPVLLLMSCLAVGAVAVAWWKRRRRSGLLEHMAFMLVVGGACGNILDRWQQGYVVDFIHVALWPAFNVADVAICAGGALVGIAMMRLKREEEGERPPPS
jgi:signal peptidase II